MDGRFAEGIGRLAALDDPVRRRVYLYVRAQRRPVTREDAAAGAAISRNLAAFHLDKLVERGLLVADYGRPTGRGGPGSGRPPKLYELADVAVSVSLPARRYDVLSGVLARAVVGSGTRVRDRALALAREDGRRRGEAWRRGAGARSERGRRAALDEGLAELGFEPAASEDGEVVLANCPFHETAQEEPALVCALNHAFSEGILEGLGATGLEALLDPAPERCCVVLRPPSVA